MSNQQSAINNSQSVFSIVTPSFKQLDWLRLCIASVRDQVPPAADISEIGDRKAESKVERNANPKSNCSGSRKAGTTGLSIQNPKLIVPPVTVEHIIQDAGSPGIEELAREVGAEFYRDGKLVFAAQNPKPEPGDLRPEVALRNAPSPRNPDHPKSNCSGSRKAGTTGLAIQNPKLSYRLAIYSESDRGMYDAINRGLEKSSGGICAWLNCDEQYLEGTLARVVELFSKTPDLDVLLGDAVLVDSKLEPVCYRRIMVPGRWHTRLDHLHSLSCAMFFKRSALPSPPLDPQWKVIGDAVLVDYFLGSRKKMIACGELLSAYAFTGKNLSANPANNEHGRWMSSTNWPPRFVRTAVVIQNRLRRLAHGAYGSFRVNIALFGMNEKAGRIQIQARVPGRWPVQTGFVSD